MTCRLPFRPLLLALLTGAALGLDVQADTIVRTDGTRIENVEISEEGLKEVAYKQAGKAATIPSAEVLSVRYEARPSAFDELESLLLVEDVEGALGMADDLAGRLLERPDRKYKWAAASAAWLAVELNERLGDDQGAVKAAERVLKNYGESRHASLAYLAKARAELRSGNAAGAAKTVAALQDQIASHSLGKRWELEARLLAAQADAQLPPSSKRNEFERIVGEAGSLPLVRGRARAAIGDSFLSEASASPAKAKGLRQEAKSAYQSVLDDDGADALALASAYAGLGEALFLLGADGDDAEVLREAVLNLLRVPTLYREQGELVARSLFYAMRCFDLMRVPERKVDMGRELSLRYAGSSWAAEAKKY